MSRYRVQVFFLTIMLLSGVLILSDQNVISPGAAEIIFLIVFILMEAWLNALFHGRRAES